MSSKKYEEGNYNLDLDLLTISYYGRHTYSVSDLNHTPTFEGLNWFQEQMPKIHVKSLDYEIII